MEFRARFWAATSFHRQMGAALPPSQLEFVRCLVFPQNIRIAGHRLAIYGILEASFIRMTRRLSPETQKLCDPVSNVFFDR